MIVEFETSKGKFAFITSPMIGIIVIGNIDEITEEEWGYVVDSMWEGNDFLNPPFDEIKYWWYDYKDTGIGYTFLTAIESGKSLMESLGIYTTNPYMIDSSYPNCNGGCLEVVCTCDLIDKWEKAQNKTANWLLVKYDNR